MTVQKGHAGDSQTLDAVTRLEQTLAGHTGASELAASRLAAARGEADGILAAATAAGTKEGLRRVAEVVARAEEEAETIRTRGRAEARELRERVLGEYDELVAELVAVVTAEET